MIRLIGEWRRYDGARPLGAIKSTVLAVFYLVIAALFAAIGGMYIASLLGNTKFFMEFAIFRGVKLTFVLPVLLVIIAYLQRFPLWKGRMINSKEEAKKFVVEFLTMDVEVLRILCNGRSWWRGMGICWPKWSYSRCSCTRS